jgi:response regulator RpfG family c-di-GMP phosphodiesterase
VSDHTLLFVDDEPNILQALRRVFRKEGYKILTATGGAEGLRYLEDRKIDLIISDHRMPQMTGLEFLYRVKERSPDTIRLLLTGYADINTAIMAINGGAVYRYLSKPWKDDDLLDVVRKGLAHRELMLENRRLTEELQAFNATLQQRVEERTEELILRNQVLTFAQEVLEHLPLGVFGITCEGWIALANEHASRVFGLEGRPLVGESAEKVFPAAIADLLKATLADGQTQQQTWIAANGTALELTCLPLGQPDPRGLILTGLPKGMRDEG